MNDLTQRAKARLAQAEVTRLTQIQQQEDKRKALPPPSYAAGFAGGVQKVLTAGQGKSNAQAITNGVLGVGDRVVRSGNLIDAMPRIRTPETPIVKDSEPPGLVLWGDSNWYAQGGFLNPDVGSTTQTRDATFAFFKQLLNWAKVKDKIYTIAYTDPRLYTREGVTFYDLSQISLASVLTDKNIEIVQLTDITQAQGPLFLQLLNNFLTQNLFTPTELSFIKKHSKKYAVFMSGDWGEWVTQGFYADVFSKLGLTRVTAFTQDSPEIEDRKHVIKYSKVAKLLTDRTIYGTGSAYFTGLKPKEIFAVDRFNRPTFARFTF